MTPSELMAWCDRQWDVYLREPFPSAAPTELTGASLEDFLFRHKGARNRRQRGRPGRLPS